MKIACIIPARLGSKRFPRKVLATFGAKPLLAWVWEAAQRCSQFDEVTFAIDAPETAELIASFGGRFFFTNTDCLSGTDRLVELKQRRAITADVWVNWQADEPFIRPAMIGDLLQTVAEKEYDVWSLRKAVTAAADVTNPNVVKVVTNKKGKALYFSRSPIPYARGNTTFSGCYFKHIGLYAFTAQALDRLSELSPSPLEQLEQLEQLRFLENGLSMQLHTTSHETVAIDRPEDLIQASILALGAHKSC
ncbi:MAG: 3-deoxy-manno-octulosonate cytidylyltransferase [Chlamydiota bacterium]